MSNLSQADAVGLPGRGSFRFFWRWLLILVMVGMQALAIVSPVLAEGGREHIVVRGENLYRIALRYGVTVQDLARANGIRNPDSIQVGQRLVIPDTGSVLTEKGGAAEDFAALPPTPEVSGSVVHVVRPGENLFRIAQQYGVSLRALADANSLADPNYVWVGQALSIPDRPQGSSFRTLSTAGPAVGGGDATDAAAAGIDFAGAPFFRLTHYCLHGPMASGRWVYLGAVAADASVFPLGTRLIIEGLGFFAVEDRFAWDARQARLDIWIPTCQEAMIRGVQYRRVLMVLSP